MGHHPALGRQIQPPRTGAFTEGIIETVVVLNPHLALHKLKLRLGEQLGEGGFGEVFLDADDNDYVIKRFFLTITPRLSHNMRLKPFNVITASRARRCFMMRSRPPI
ncbi:hypothetical protein SODG_006162 [Sodalis praecaptivus]